MKAINRLKLIVFPVLSQFYCTQAALDFANSTTLLNEFTNFCYKRDLPRAMKAMNSMQNHGIYADCVTYSELIKCCVSFKAVEEGKLVHKHVLGKGYNPGTFLYNVLLHMYVKFNLLDEAQILFDQMHERNVVSWTTLISAFSNSKLNDRALGLLVLMGREGIWPNMFTYSSVLRACDDSWNLRQLHCSIVKVGFDSDVFVRSAMIDVYAKLGELENALAVFNEMVTGDLVVWNSIIGGFAQNSEGETALRLYKSMKRAGFLADESTLTSILRACTSLALLELGRQVHVHVTKFGRDLILDNALLDMYCKCGSLDTAKFAFDRMVKRDVISWSTMIAGLAQNGYSREALQLFESMRILGTKPNYITILGVLFACSHAGLVDDGWYYFRSMKKLFGIDPRREHYGCMIDLLGRAGKLEEAVNLTREMECEPDIVTWRTLLGACRVHHNVGLATFVAQKILELEPHDPGAHILLSNVYANSERWKDVVEVRRNMRSKGVNKEPGCSWIEFNKQIHVFIMGDSSHPQIEEIDKELHLLIHRLREVGYFPNTNFVLQDIEGEQKEESLQYHSEKLAIVFGLLNLSKEVTIRIMKNIRICGDCHNFAKLVTKVEQRTVVIRDPIRFHHFQDGTCSCGDYW